MRRDVSSDFFADREYANCATALRLALRQQVSILEPCRVLFDYLDAVHDELRGPQLANIVIEA